MNERRDLAEIFPFYKELGEEERALLTEGAVTRTFEVGEVIHAGDGVCTGPLLVIRGRVRAYMLSEEGREVTLYRLAAGDFCPLSAPCLVDAVTFPVTMEAESRTEATVFATAPFAELCRRCPHAESYMLRAAVLRFSDVMSAFRGILFHSLDARLAAFLVGEVDRHGGDTVYRTQEEIAAYTGSAREAVSRRLKALAADGLLEVKRGGVRLLRTDDLRALSQRSLK